MTELATMIRDLGANFNATSEQLGTRISDLEKRAAREPDHANDNGYGGSALFSAVESSTDIRSLTSTTRGRAVISLLGERADITSSNTTVGAGRSQGTSLVPGQRLPGIIAPPERKLTIRDVIGSAPTTSSSLEYVVEESFSNNAAPQVETQAKAKSDLTFNMKNATVRTLAHIFYASKQILDDTPALAGYIAARGSYGLRFVEENQILNGNGTGQNLSGILPTATVFDETLRKAGSTRIDLLRRALQQVRRTELEANAFVLHPDDWAEIELTKDAGGNMIVGDPLAPIQSKIWGLPVIQTQSIPAGTFLTGSFDIGAQIFDRQNVTVDISTEHADLFERNMVAIRIESRLALAVYRPTAFVKGAFTL